jgi:hypothetical protein
MLANWLGVGMLARCCFLVWLFYVMNFRESGDIWWVCLAVATRWCC